MIFDCPVCGKETEAMWPEQWRYKYKGKHVCSWGCLRKLQKKDEAKTAAYYRINETDGEEDEPMNRITLEQKKKAVQIAISGGDPLEHLKRCGSEAPDKLWYYIKNRLKVTDPELYAQIPDMRKKETRKEPETKAPDRAQEAPAGKPEEPKTLDGSAWEPWEPKKAEERREKKMADARYYGGYKVLTERIADTKDKMKFIRESVDELVSDMEAFTENYDIEPDFSTMKIIIRETNEQKNGPFSCDEDGIPKSWALTVGLRFEKKEEPGA